MTEALGTKATEAAFVIIRKNISPPLMRFETDNLAPIENRFELNLPLHLVSGCLSWLAVGVYSQRD